MTTATVTTTITLVALPGDEPRGVPEGRRVALVPRADRRAAITLVSWLVPGGAARERAERA